MTRLDGNEVVIASEAIQGHRLRPTIPFVASLLAMTIPTERDMR